MHTRRQIDSIRHFFNIFIEAFKELGKNDPLRMAGATAFFTTFALPPILIILIQVLGLIFDPQRISRELFINLADIIGRKSVQQVVDTLIAFRRLAQNWYITIGGFLFLVFVATTLFKVIKSSLNQVWKIKVMQRRGFRMAMRTRLKSIVVILLAGALFVIGLLAEGLQAFLAHYMAEFSPAVEHYFSPAVNLFLAVIIVTFWFAILFRFLTDARPHWKVVWPGALLTSLLFNIGKTVLRWLLTYSNIDTIYGASGSIVLLLLFVFYSSLILYYGAAFTKVWGSYSGRPIKPRPYAIHYQLAETDV